MLYNSSNTQNTVTFVPAITYVFVGLTSFVLAYFTAMDKGEDSESLPKDESVTSMLPGLGTMVTTSASESENGEEGDDEASTTESETEPDQSTYESESKPAPVTGGKKRKNSIKKQTKKTKSKRSTKSRSS